MSTGRLPDGREHGAWETCRSVEFLLVEESLKQLNCKRLTVYVTVYANDPAKRVSMVFISGSLSLGCVLICNSRLDACWKSFTFNASTGALGPPGEDVRETEKEGRGSLERGIFRKCITGDELDDIVLDN